MLKSIIILFLLGITAFTTTTQLYTRHQVEKVAKKCATNYVTEVIYTGQGSIHLGDLLYANVHIQLDSLKCEPKRAGKETPVCYKNGWRKTFIDNPDMGLIAIKTFGSSFLQTFEKEIESNYKAISSLNADWRKDPAISVRERLEIQNRVNHFCPKAYRFDLHLQLYNYEMLIDKLLELPDSQLTIILLEVALNNEPCGMPAMTAKRWLLQHNLIQSVPVYTNSYAYRGQLWSLSKYPVDLMLLVFRISRDYPTYSHKEILAKAKTYISTLRETLRY